MNDLNNITASNIHISTNTIFGFFKHLIHVYALVLTLILLISFSSFYFFHELWPNNLLQFIYISVISLWLYRKGTFEATHLLAVSYMKSGMVCYLFSSIYFFFKMQAQLEPHFLYLFIVLLLSLTLFFLLQLIQQERNQARVNKHFHH